MIKRLLFLLLLVGLPTFAAYQQQGFSQFQELDGNVNFVCTAQCFALIGPMAWSDTFTLNWTFQGNGAVGYGFVVWQQIIPGDTIQINWETVVNQQFAFTKMQFYSQIPKEAQVVMIVQGAVTGNQVGIQIWALSFFEKFSNGFKQALEYKEYNPRTINFLEWPMRNGKYINQYFLPRILILLAFALAAYRFSTDRKNKQKAIWFGIWVFAFFWIFFDFFSTNNQIKFYNITMSASNIMENGRVGRTSDFYQFLDFIKTKVPKWAEWAFISPYPFYFEGKYHIYPDVKFNIITWVNYIFYYNPYGSQTPSDFKEPIYSGGFLIWNNITFIVKEEIIRQPYAKIYRLLSK